MKNIEINSVHYGDKEVLRNLMEFYLYDFSEMEHFDLHPHGRFEYKYLDHYWTDDTRFPYFIKVDGMYAGFALVRQDENGVYSIAEFFVMRKYRKKNIGEVAAKSVFDLHPGKWEVSELASNKGAQVFWKKIISEYTNGHFLEKVCDDENWKGVIQTFKNNP